ncbi:hypothetical protein D8674_012878 [Pyrus ussuriensis x Pyrus communis]|uniref:Uncharacterized protein n=1 Tax=Pyrus ussuriensis x Pyrus communis TaxID=2448454 RepID=A0A5N5GN88_9ROSA|nr:hypothetical protein D8674_012878 [Pyrus ussuriensis x Pyrus communis]
MHAKNIYQKLEGKFEIEKSRLTVVEGVKVSSTFVELHNRVFVFHWVFPQSKVKSELHRPLENFE